MWKTESFDHASSLAEFLNEKHLLHYQIFITKEMLMNGLRLILLMPFLLKVILCQQQLYILMKQTIIFFFFYAESLSEAYINKNG